MHSNSPNKPKKFKETLSIRMCMTTLLWGRKWVLVARPASYSVTLERIQSAIQNKRRGILSLGNVLLHDNPWVHTAAETKRLLQCLRWEGFDHPPYCPDLVPSDFCIFPSMKLWIGGHNFGRWKWAADKLSKFAESKSDKYDKWIEKNSPRTYFIHT